MEQVYICIDLKSYYASVECVARGLNPLKANLLVADESRTDKTICLAVSPNLKAHGVSSRPRLFEAVEQIRLEEARIHQNIEYIVAKPRMQKYIDTSAFIYTIYLRFVAKEDIHVYSIDECFINAGPYLHLYHGSPRKMAITMIRAVLKETGITATVGIGTNLYLAKVAMDIVAKKQKADADGVRVAELCEESFRALLWDHKPLTDFWQTGAGTMRRLLKYGIHTMGELARFSIREEELLYREFGINAELIIDHAWGIETCSMADIQAYEPKGHSITQGQVLPRPYHFGEARLVLREMTEGVALRLEENRLVAKTLGFMVHFDPASMEETNYMGPVHMDYYGRLTPNHIGKSMKLRQSTSSPSQITDSIVNAYNRLVDPSLLIRVLNVEAMDLEAAGMEQLDLFTDYEKKDRERNLQRAMLRIREKCGPGYLVKGTSLCEGATAIERSRQIGGHRA